MHLGSSSHLLRSGDHMAWERVQTTHGSLCEMQQRSLAYVTKHVYGTFHLPPTRRQRRPPDKNATCHTMSRSMWPPYPMLRIRWWNKTAGGNHTPGRPHETWMPGHRGPPIRSEIPDMGPSESEYLCFCTPPHEYVRNESELGPIPPGLNSIRHKHRCSTDWDNYPTLSQYTT